jgi:DNA-binding NarL/FixJ family response regulator
MRCVVVEDQVVFADLLGAVLGSLTGVEVAAVAHEVKTAEAECRRHRPELLLLNPEVPGGDAFGVIRRLARAVPASRTVLLSRSQRRVVLPSDVRGHVHTVIGRADGFSVLRGEIGRLREAQAPQVSPLHILGPRERELFGHIGRGLRSKEIADAMGLTKASVDTYRKRISSKLRSSGADLVRLAALHGQLPLAA